MRPAFGRAIGETVWWRRWGRHAWRIDPLTRTASSTVSVGNGRFGIATGAGSMWVANTSEGTFPGSVPSANQLVATIDAEYFRCWLDVGDGCVWIGVGAEQYDIGTP